MSGEPPALVVAIEIGEPELADRLAALLADVPGLEARGAGRARRRDPRGPGRAGAGRRP